LLSWLAAPIQELGLHCDAAVLVFGEQGTGKSLFFDVLMRNIYGGFHHTINNSSELFDRFNSDLEGKLFVLCDGECPDPVPGSGYLVQLCVS
jgi:putative DNA primase/helicase